MTACPILLDVVALKVDVPAERLVRGQVGTIVEMLSDEHAEIEFSDDQGKAYALSPLPLEQLIVLHHAPIASH